MFHYRSICIRKIDGHVLCILVVLLLTQVFACIAQDSDADWMYDSYLDMTNNGWNPEWHPTVKMIKLSFFLTGMESTLQGLSHEMTIQRLECENVGRYRDAFYQYLGDSSFEVGMIEWLDQNAIANGGVLDHGDMALSLARAFSTYDWRSRSPSP